MATHDQRIQTIKDGLVALQALPITSQNQQMIALFSAVLEEIIAIRASLINLPLPTNMKNLD
jgi:hypothetical protein